MSQNSPKLNETSGYPEGEVIPPDLGGPAKLGQTHINVSAAKAAVTKKPVTKAEVVKKPTAKAEGVKKPAAKAKVAKRPAAKVEVAKKPAAKADVAKKTNETKKK